MIICILSTRDAGVAVEPNNFALRSGIQHIYFKVMDFEKDLDLRRWQMISHLRPNLKKKFCSLFILWSLLGHAGTVDFSAVWKFWSRLHTDFTFLLFDLCPHKQTFHHVNFQLFWKNLLFWSSWIVFWFGIILSKNS